MSVFWFIFFLENCSENSNYLDILIFIIQFFIVFLSRPFMGRFIWAKCRPIIYFIICENVLQFQTAKNLSFNFVNVTELRYILSLVWEKWLSRNIFSYILAKIKIIFKKWPICSGYPKWLNRRNGITFYVGICFPFYIVF